MKTYALNSSWKLVTPREGNEPMLEPGYYKVGRTSKNLNKIAFLLKAGFGVSVARPQDCSYFMKIVDASEEGRVRAELRNLGYIDKAMKCYS